MIERDFDIPFIADLALREKQIQQNYRPIIAVHKWFARRPGTLFRGLLLSEFVPVGLREAFYKSNDLSGLRIADPFMGGGTPVLEANRLGCDVVGYDINSMAYWIVKEEIEHISLSQYRKAAQRLRTQLEGEIGHLYRTTCRLCGSPDAHVKYFLWVKSQNCVSCGQSIELFPGYLVARDRRHPKNVLACASCGELNEVLQRERPGDCTSCGEPLHVHGPATRGFCTCASCGTMNRYPLSEAGPPRHRLFAIEYFCPDCRPRHEGRFFKKPDAQDAAKFSEAETRLGRIRPRFLPDDPIPTGDETNRLHRWGLQCYRDMFNARQLLGLELSCRLIAALKPGGVRDALATNLSDLLRYQNMLCRYDTTALKSLDIFSVHGFPIGLVQCESNLLGLRRKDNGENVGSGGWSNIVDKFAKAKSYCDRPYEIRHRGRRKERVLVAGEWIGETRSDDLLSAGSRRVELFASDAAEAKLAPGSLDGVFTDPPYYANVQYAELMDFCYVWLRRLVGADSPAFSRPTTRNPQELTGNEDMGRGLPQFTDGLSSVFQRMAQALKPGAPLVFTYHHNSLDAYYPVAVALLDAGLTCSASLPCPAEMGASIHINGTCSSIVDTVFVARSTGTVPRAWLAGTPEELARIVKDDVSQLQAGNVKTTHGDIRCIINGHLIRLAVWCLRSGWRKMEPAAKRIVAVSRWIQGFGGVEAVWDNLQDVLSEAAPVGESVLMEARRTYGVDGDEVPF